MINTNPSIQPCHLISTAPSILSCNNIQSQNGLSVSTQQHLEDLSIHETNNNNNDNDMTDENDNDVKIDILNNI